MMFVEAKGFLTRPPYRYIPKLRYRDNYLLFMSWSVVPSILVGTPAFTAGAPGREPSESPTDYSRRLVGWVREGGSTAIAMLCEVIIPQWSEGLGIPVQYEQDREEISFLLAQVSTKVGLQGCRDCPWAPISAKDPVWDGPVAKRTITRWLDPHAPNAQTMLVSMVPNVVKTAQHFRQN